MRRAKTCFLLLLQLWCISGTFAKSKDTTGFYILKAEEKKLSVIAPLITAGETDSVRMVSAFGLFRKLDTLLQTPGSYWYPFDSLKVRTVSILTSPDNKFRLFTFNQINTNGDFKNYGLLQMNNKESTVYSFMDTSKKHAADFLEVELDISEWYGALYYGIIPFKHHRKKSYLLLGFDGSNIHSNKKVLDVLWFDQGTPVFGKDVFRSNNFNTKTTCRVVFEFHNSSIMLLHYEAKEKIVILDKLVPAFPAAVNDFYYYIPSGDYDFYQYKKQYWVRNDLKDFNLGQGSRNRRNGPLPTPESDPQNSGN